MRVAFDIPHGIISDDTGFASSPAWTDGSNVRFRGKRPQVIGGWESAATATLPGVCRTAFPWTDTANTLHIALGQHNKLHVHKGSRLYDITPSSGFAAGAIDGAPSSGYGTGSYGTGDYGEDSTADYFALTWSLAAWGQKLLACPRNQTIFEWSNNTANPAAAISNAPDNVTYMLVAPQRQVFALGCNEEVSGTFNPVCIRHSSVGDNTDWTTTSSSASTAREYILPGGGRIVGGRVMGRYILVWTNSSLFLGTFYGQIGKVWSFEKIGDGCGLIGPNAAVVKDSVAFWISPDRQFHSYSLGGAVQTITCPLRKEFSDNLALAQSDKIVASTISEYSEVRWDYPDSRDGYENSRYVAICISGPDAGAWYKGEMARTAMVDAGAANYPLGVTYDGQLYWHERGRSADGAALSWFIETSDLYLSDDNTALARSMWGDFEDQVGGVTVTAKTKVYPQGDETDYTLGTLSPYDDKLDFKAAGRMFRLKFSGNSAPSYARLGRLVFDVRLRGRK